ncbi:MAG: DUF2892 domain-containing protein [Lysobacterales bacterium]
MNLDRAVMAFAGVMVLLSAALAHWVSPWWWLLGVFVGANLFQAAFTGWCPAAKLFAALGIEPGKVFR